MKPLIPYLFFNGNCREAMNFYKQCFDGELQLMTYADAPADENCNSKGAKDNEIMHASLTNGIFMLMASDWPEGGAKQGNNVSLNINCQSIAEIEKLFKALAADGEVVQALTDTFWGARFGMLVDKFGIHWMLNCELKK